MCFSEEASFIAAGVLSLASGICFRLTREKPQFLALCFIPLFFAIQQFAEGIEWLYFKDIWGTQEVFNMARTTFLFIALIVWPIWIPFSFMKAEDDPLRKKYLKAILFLGALLAIFNSWKLFFFPVKAIVAFKSVQYYVDIPSNELIIYAMIVISPWFISSLPRARTIGSVLSVMSVIVYFTYLGVFISVWCFFSALVCGSLIYMLEAYRHEPAVQISGKKSENDSDSKKPD